MKSTTLHCFVGGTRERDVEGLLKTSPLIKCHQEYSPVPLSLPTTGKIKTCNNIYNEIFKFDSHVNQVEDLKNKTRCINNGEIRAVSIFCSHHNWLG